MKKFLVMVALVAFAATMLGCGGASPKAAFNDFAAAIKAKDAEKSWNLMSKATQDSFNKMYDMIKGLAAMSPEGAKELEGVTDGKTFWKKAVTEAGKSGADMTKEFENVSVTKEDISGDKAILTVKSGDKEEKINMVKEGGKWLLDMSQEMGGVK